MPAVSKAQQQFMGAVLAAKRGDLKNPSKSVRRAAESMTEGDVRDFAKTKHKGLPERKSEKKASWLDEIFARGVLSRLSELRRRQ